MSPSPASSSKNSVKSRHAWSVAAPNELTSLGAPADPAVWPRWRETLAARRAAELQVAASSGLGCGLPSVWTDALEALSRRLTTAAPNELASELASLIEAAREPLLDWQSPEPPAALELVQWATALPRMAARLASADWLGLVEQLASLARDAGALTGKAWQSLLAVWLAVELPLALSEAAPELDELRRLGLAGKRELERQLDDWLDGAGFPAGWALPWAIPCLASWTRCRAVLDAESSFAPWRDDAERQLADFAKICLSLRRGDGRPALTAAPDCDDVDGLFEYLAQASDKRAATLDAKLVQRATAGPSLKAKLGLGETTPDETSATHSEWGGGAIIRSAWDRSTVLLAARFDEGGCVDIDLSADRTPWLAGRWTFEATHNGAPLAPEGGWDVVCWLDDAESIYLELEQELKAVGSGVGGRLQRQLLIAKKDRFAVGLDAVFELPVGELEYVSSLPIAPGTTAEVAERSVEILLRRENASSRLLPLPLPEWKRESPNRFWPQVEDGRTTFRLAETGRACCYAWLVDLDVKRAREEFTWRRLTIAEDRRTLARDEAFGARVQIGRKHNWLIYRTLGKSANRTILGKNLTSDFFCGRILKTGLTQVISEVEA